MDKILEGIVTSEHPEGVKRALISKILNSASQQTQKGQIEGVLQLSSRWICNEDSIFLQEVGQQVFEAWAVHHRDVLEDFLCQNFLVSVFVTEVNNPARVLRFVKECLRIISDTSQACSLLQKQSISLSRDYPDIAVLAELSSLLLDFPSCMPEGNYSFALIQYIIRHLSKLRTPVTENEQRKCLLDVTLISKAVNSIWHRNVQAIPPSLTCLFEVISQVSVEDAALAPSPALGSLVQFIPENVIELVIKKVTSNPAVSDEQLKTALTRIVDWLSWPGVRNVDQWAISFLKSLASVQKFSILIHVTIATVELVFLKLSFPLVRRSAMAVFEHMMLSFQHSPEAFHKITGQVPDIVSKLQSENSASSQECCKRLSELLYTLMYQFPGYPELYVPVIEAIKMYPRPPEDTMKASLLLVKWTATKSLFGLSSKFAPRSETGKAGLVNLGNTCYMNSIIQALFVIKGFREDVLNFPLAVSKQSVMVQLQTTFAFLAHTQRAAYSPEKFLEVSRPPWFNAGAQQDCSEFLKYLLDRIDEEESTLLKLQASPIADRSSHGNTSPSKKDGILRDSSDGPLPTTPAKPSNTLVQNYFGGKSMTSTRCLKCDYVSHREEAFVDIPLAFPETDATSRTKGLGGGDAKKRPCPDVAVCESEDLHEAKIVEMDQGPSSVHTLVDEGFTPDEAYAYQQASGSSQTPKEKDLETLLKHYFSPELLSGDNQYHCDSCHHLQDAQKTSHIIKAPEILVLTLMRFSYDALLQRRCKIQDHVKLPKNLNLLRKNQNLMVGPRLDSEEDEEERTLPETKKLKADEMVEDGDEESVDYTLIGAVVHSGLSSESGHYYCYGRTDYIDDSLTSLDAHGNREEQWCLFNDDRVSHSSFESLSNISSRFCNDTAYVLFYQKLSSRQSTSQHFTNTAVRATFQDMVARDNSAYLQEQELEARREKSSRRTVLADQQWYKAKDPDDRNEPPGGCGLGGGGGGVPSGHLVF
ncbi:Ubiquitin carboxyl-terminal hydrolase 38 [Holothuria leucospilota]|uniref:Ubiquitin carboxyl-terminal hydrolase 38 n=1 Tax=Holothuria leucospilota TaxID=206669 RepID=A0A9Q1BKF7_HOLLE|nr:Ubiquitin carboxyl-terminal hydrolase 38 [Holothuria leucospilota]